MVDSYVVVAIPSKDDYVWQLSSEKVPHLTLLYLDSRLSDVGRVEEYIKHCVDTMLSKFHLSVNRREVLGPQSADVLIFDNGYYNLKMLTEFRNYLLDDNDIRTAYDSVEQYPAWIPHLTMGYPETPAKPDDRDYPGINWVCFDRIALWTQDYSGTEFTLNNDEYGDVARMSAAGADFLSHFGVKGMKWGVVKEKLGPTGKKLVVPSQDHINAAVVKGRAKIGGVHTLSNKDLQQIIRRMDLEVKFKELKTVQHNQSLIGRGANWVGRVLTDILVGTTISWLRRPGSRKDAYAMGRDRKAISNRLVVNGEVIPPRALPPSS